MHQQQAKTRRRLATQQARAFPRRRSVHRAQARLAGVAYRPTYEPSSPTARAIEEARKFASKRKRLGRKKAAK
jgi:hypothetical protein